MPGKGKRPAVSQGIGAGGLSDNEANMNNQNAEERKAYLATEADQAIQKQIRPRLRSGAAFNTENMGGINPSAASESKQLADQHAKRLKVAKSSRVTLGLSEAQKPSRLRGIANNGIGEVDLSLAGKSPNLLPPATEAQLPQSMLNQQMRS